MLVIPTALPIPVVIINPRSLEIFSGQSPTLTCTVTVEEYLFVVPSLGWTNSSGQELGGVFVTTLIDNTVITSNLSFTGLRTSQAETYTCTVKISIPSVDIVDLVNSNQIDVTAQSKCIHQAIPNIRICDNVLMLSLQFPLLKCPYLQTSHTTMALTTLSPVSSPLTPVSTRLSVSWWSGVVRVFHS